VCRTRGFTLAGVVDAAAASRAWATETLGVRAFGTLDRALAICRPDVVVLVSPPATHRRLAETALAAGCHVVTEKPLALELGEAQAAVAAADRAGRILMVAQNYRFRRQSRALQALVAGGELGALLGLRITFRKDLRTAWISPRDWRGRMPHPLLFDMAIHHVDLIRQITGRDVAVADGRSWLAPDSPFHHDPNVAAVLTLAGGLPAAYEGSWAAPDRHTSWNGDWELVGSNARACWTGAPTAALRGRVTLERYGSAPEVVALPVLPALDRRGVLWELRRAIATGEQPEAAGADNLVSLAAVVALARSTETGAPVATAGLLR
jgi:predicted dehydrogenase